MINFLVGDAGKVLGIYSHWGWNSELWHWVGQLYPFKFCKVSCLGLEESVNQSGSWQETRFSSDGSNVRKLMKELLSDVWAGLRKQIGLRCQASSRVSCHQPQGEKGPRAELWLPEPGGTRNHRAGAPSRGWSPRGSSHCKGSSPEVGGNKKELPTLSCHLLSVCQEMEADGS